MTRRIAILNVLLGAAVTVAGAQQIPINAAGATFPYPMYSKWFDEYHKKFPTLQFNYQSIGSGGGIQQVTQGTVDFGATDGPMNETQLKEFAAKHGGSGILHFPTVMGADVPAYNVAGISQPLNFTPEALAGIFLGKITKWNDPALVAANPGVSLPTRDIVVVHRSDGSGTSYIFTDYLSKVSKDWESGPGRGSAVNWPTGVAGKGNENVAGLVRQMPGSIGYVELIYALQNHIDFSQVGLMGHSRGGEGVRAAYTQYRDAGSIWPGRIVTPVNFRAIFEIGPVDGQTSRVLNASNTKWAVILPMCDGDVSDLEGMPPYDRMNAVFNETNPTFKATSLSSMRP